ncbi:hypothetical protein F4808DRAFT_33779 [Astrocystis sublimbata]|nr:hypothetical protein F4808DRAFT_33779 [Astrocystis sublimbata]
MTLFTALFLCIMIVIYTHTFIYLYCLFPVFLCYSLSLPYFPHLFPPFISVFFSFWFAHRHSHPLYILEKTACVREGGMGGVLDGARIIRVPLPPHTYEGGGRISWFP